MDPSYFRSQFRPHRSSREQFRGVGTAFFTIAIDDRRPAFSDRALAGECVKLLTSSVRRARCRSDAYCFMPDHLHVLVTGLVENADAWIAVVSFKQQSGQHFWKMNSAFKWQQSFVPQILAPGRSTDAVAEYILNNPVRGGLVDHWQDYPLAGRIEREHWRYTV